jgi:hypothetical protein
VEEHERRPIAPPFEGDVQSSYFDFIHAAFLPAGGKFDYLDLFSFAYLPFSNHLHGLALFLCIDKFFDKLLHGGSDPSQGMPSWCVFGKPPDKLTHTTAVAGLIFIPTACVR